MANAFIQLYFVVAKLNRVREKRLSFALDKKSGQAVGFSQRIKNCTNIMDFSSENKHIGLKPSVVCLSKYRPINRTAKDILHIFIQSVKHSTK